MRLIFVITPPLYGALVGHLHTKTGKKWQITTKIETV